MARVRRAVIDDSTKQASFLDWLIIARFKLPKRWDTLARKRCGFDILESARPCRLGECSALPCSTDNLAAITLYPGRQSVLDGNTSNFYTLSGSARPTPRWRDLTAVPGLPRASGGPDAHSWADAGGGRPGCLPGGCRSISLSPTHPGAAGTLAGVGSCCVARSFLRWQFLCLRELCEFCQLGWSHRCFQRTCPQHSSEPRVELVSPCAGWLNCSTLLVWLHSMVLCEPHCNELGALKGDFFES